MKRRGVQDDSINVASRRSSHRRSREQTLADLRARARSGLPTTKTAVRNTGLYDRAVREFGNWTSALAAAGLLPVHLAHPPRPAAPPEVRLTEALLHSPLPNRSIEAMTGIDRKTIRRLRAERGLIMPAPAPRPKGPRPPQRARRACVRRILTEAEVRMVSERLAELDERPADIVCRRVLSLRPDTLAVLGRDWAISRERVRQIERAALDELLADPD